MATNTNSNIFSRIGLILLLALPLLLTGCGQKGDLYHPDQASRSTIHAG
ncbi:MAG: lipoprotein [Sulfuriflexus sp.]|nr:lipoprotein [Sulfuriflexus sp.]